MQFYPVIDYAISCYVWLNSADNFSSSFATLCSGRKDWATLEVPQPGQQHHTVEWKMGNGKWKMENGIAAVKGKAENHQRIWLTARAESAEQSRAAQRSPPQTNVDSAKLTEMNLRLKPNN